MYLEGGKAHGESQSVEKFHDYDAIFHTSNILIFIEYFMLILFIVLTINLYRVYPNRSPGIYFL